MGETELKVINLFKENSTLSITQVAQTLGVSRAIASKYLNRNSHILLENGRTIEEQLEYNKVYGTSNGAVVKNKKDTERREEIETQVVEYFKKNPKKTLDEIAEIFEIAKSTVSKYLSAHKDEVLPNGLTIKNQLSTNQQRGRTNGADLIGRNCVAIKGKAGRFTGSISTISPIGGKSFHLTSKAGIRIGSLTITDKMEEQLTREAIYYLVHNKSIEKTAEELNISRRTLQLHLKKLVVYNENLYRLVKEKKQENQAIGRLNHAHKGGKASMYSQTLIDYICDDMLKNELTYKQASEKFDIPTSTLFELMKRVNEQRRCQLDILAAANHRKMSKNEYIEETKHGKK